MTGYGARRATSLDTDTRTAERHAPRLRDPTTMSYASQSAATSASTTAGWRAAPHGHRHDAVAVADKRERAEQLGEEQPPVVRRHEARADRSVVVAASTLRPRARGHGR